MSNIATADMFLPCIFTSILKMYLWENKDTQKITIVIKKKLASLLSQKTFTLKQTQSSSKLAS